ncbi:MAG: flavodoxin family protein [Coriobacteriia bacterium]
MKVVAFSGSARKDGNTALLVRAVFEPLEERGIACELVQLAGKKCGGCTACLKCREMKDRRCHGRDDAINECVVKMDEADGVIIATPTYFADVSSETKALIDRCGYVAMSNGAMLRRKVGAAVVAVRRGGAIHAFDTINHFFLINQMVVPGSSYWNVGIGRDKGEVSGDEEGLRTMRVLGENMAWALERLHG